jgi:DNA polymerase-4
VVADGRRKSMGTETTFGRDLTSWDEVAAAVVPLFDGIWTSCVESDLVARTLTVKVKYADFRQITRSRSLAGGIATRTVMEELVRELLRPLFPPRQGVRLLGITLSNFNELGGETSRQLALTLG